MQTRTPFNPLNSTSHRHCHILLCPTYRNMINEVKINVCVFVFSSPFQFTWTHYKAATCLTFFYHICMLSSFLCPHLVSCSYDCTKHLGCLWVFSYIFFAYTSTIFVHIVHMHQPSKTSQFRYIQGLVQQLLCKVFQHRFFLLVAINAQQIYGQKYLYFGIHLSLRDKQSNKKKCVLERSGQVEKPHY